jgi:hypothetical protein
VKTGSYFPVSNSIVGALMLLMVSVVSGCGASPDQRLVGSWQGTNRFTGISYREAVDKKVAVQPVETVLVIATNGVVTGHIGGARLTNCVVAANRGWLGRKLHLASDFVIQGQIVGPVVSGSEGGTHNISAPFNLVGGQIRGTVFVLYNFKAPYPFMPLRVDHGP